jgi:hypothetical protein
MLPSGSGDHFCSLLVALLWKWLFTVLVYWDFHAGGLVLCSAPFLWGRFSVPSAPSAVSVLWWFAVCFSVLWDSLALGVAHWLKRWTLWSTTCPASERGLLPTHSPPSCLSSVCLLKVWVEISSLPLPLSWSTVSVPTSSAVMQITIRCLNFRVFFWGGGCQST